MRCVSRALIRGRRASPRWYTWARPVDFESLSQQHRETIDGRINQLLQGVEGQPESLHRAMSYAVTSGGKRLRPIITLSLAEAVGGKANSALDAACAVEFVHCFSLIHDDLPCLDNDDLRRGMPTVHVAFSEAIALLAGDALFALAFETLAKAEADPGVRADALALLAECSGTRGMVGGQTVDIESVNAQVDLDTVEWIHRRKTGALIEAAAGLGAMFGGGTPEDISRARRYGGELGLAFQIADDILDETSTTEALGKRSQADRDLAKATYPAAVGIERALALANKAAERAIAEAQGLARPEVACAIARFAVERRS